MKKSTLQILGLILLTALALAASTAIRYPDYESLHSCPCFTAGTITGYSGGGDVYYHYNYRVNGRLYTQTKSRYTKLEKIGSKLVVAFICNRPEVSFMLQDHLLPDTVKTNRSLYEEEVGEYEIGFWEYF